MSAGETVTFCDWIDDLLALDAPPPFQRAVVAAYRTRNDGGGGEFYWDAASRDEDDRGTVIAPKPGAAGRWIRIFDGPISVKWFGATGDGKADAAAETRAINAAFALAAKRTVRANNFGSSPAVVFPRGHYRIDAPLCPCQPMGPGQPANGYITILGTDQPVIEQTAPDHPIVDASYPGQAAARVARITGITFLNGTHQIYFASSESASDTTIRIADCEFHGSSSYAIFADVPRRPRPLPGPDSTSLVPPLEDHYDGMMTISDCRFVDCRFAVMTYCDRTVVSGCWVHPKGIAQRIAPPDAVFRNCAVRGRFDLIDTECAGPTARSLDALAYFRWVVNVGSFFARRVKFGGEGAGMPILYHYGSPQSAYPWHGDTVSIEDSIVCVPENADDSAVILLVEGVPKEIVYRNNDDPVGGPFGTPIVKVLPVFGEPGTPTVYEAGLAQYLSRYTGVRFRATIQGDLQGGGERAFPPELLPFVNLLESPPFPAASLPADSVVGNNCSKWYPIPASLLQGFVVMVTASLCPNAAVSSQAREARTFLVAMTSDGHARSLTPTPLTQSPVNLDVSLRLVSPPGEPERFLIGFQWYITGATAPPEHGAISVTPIHAMAPLPPSPPPRPKPPVVPPPA